jgi:hypothetical protein
MQELADNISAEEMRAIRKKIVNHVQADANQNLIALNLRTADDFDDFTIDLIGQVNDVMPESNYYGETEVKMWIENNVASVQLGEGARSVAMDNEPEIMRIFEDMIRTAILEMEITINL